MKFVFKIVFFLITISSLIAVVILFFIVVHYVINCLNQFDNLNKISIEALCSLITILVPAISSLIVAFIKIPEIIAKYLFDTEEDNNMNSIIKNIQNYDKAMFAMEQKIENLLMKNKDYSLDVQDESFEDSPARRTGTV